MSDQALTLPAEKTAAAPKRRPLPRPLAQATVPRRRITWGYIAWSILPVIIAVIFSFNDGRSRSTWQGFSLRWWWRGRRSTRCSTTRRSRSAIVQSIKLSFVTMIIAVPLGLLFAIGLDRWRGRPARGANFVMLLSFVMPEIIIGVSLFYLFSFLYKSFVPLGTPAQILGLITFQISYPVIIIRARLLTIAQRLRGGGDGPGGHADPGAAPRAAATAVPRDLRQRRTGVRRHDRRLRHRELPVVGPVDRSRSR